MPGILFAMVAATLFGVALTIQKHAVGRMETFSLARMARSRVWLLSLAVGGVGILAYLLALRSASLSAVQPLMSLSLLIPVIAGMIFFKERLQVVEWVFVIVFFIGIGIVSLS